MSKKIEKKSPQNRNKDNIGWRYCLTMMLLCFMIGLLCHSLWVQFQDSRYARVWEADKMRTLDRCDRFAKLALAVASTRHPGSSELEAWFRARTAVDQVPLELRQDYQNWQVFSATHAAIAQLEYFELKNMLSEADPFKEDFEAFGALIDLLYADTGKPIQSN